MRQETLKWAFCNQQLFKHRHRHCRVENPRNILIWIFHMEVPRSVISKYQQSHSEGLVIKHSPRSVKPINILTPLFLFSNRSIFSFKNEDIKNGEIFDHHTNNVDDLSSGPRHRPMSRCGCGSKQSSTSSTRLSKDQ